MNEFTSKICNICIYDLHEQLCASSITNLFFCFFLQKICRIILRKKKTFYTSLFYSFFCDCAIVMNVTKMQERKKKQKIVSYRLQKLQHNFTTQYSFVASFTRKNDEKNEPEFKQPFSVCLVHIKMVQKRVKSLLTFQNLTQLSLLVYINTFTYFFFFIILCVYYTSSILYG